MAQSLFTSQTPAFRDNADGTDSYSMGTYFTPAVDGTITHIRWWFPQSGQPGAVAPKANLFRTSDSAKIGGADAVFGYPGTPDDWNQIALSAPVSVTGGTQYCATIWTPLRYVATSGGASPWPLTNGDLSAPVNAGRFTSGVSGNVDFPTNTFSNGCYFVDVVFSADSDPAEGSSALGLELAVAATGARDSGGVAAAGLELVVAGSGSISAEGVAAAGLGLTVAAAGARPASGSAAFSLGLALAGAGARNSQGLAQLGVGLAVSATGSNGQTGRPVKPWPGTVVPVSSYPWTPRPVRSFQEVQHP